MSSSTEAVPPAPLLKAARRLLRPLVRLLIRSGVTFPILADVLRGLFVEVAQESLSDPRARTDSRVSLMTGVHRKELKRLREAGHADDPEPAIVTVSTQAIARWCQPLFADAEGRPRPLPRFAQPGDGASFEALITNVTKDVRPRAVLDDWIAQGLCTLDDDDHVHLNAAAYLPRSGGAEQLYFFGRNLHDHLAAATANVASSAPPFLDRSLHFDRMTPEAAAQLEEYAREAGMRVLMEANRLALTLDEPDAERAPQQPTRRVNFGVYVYSETEPPASGTIA